MKVPVITIAHIIEQLQPSFEIFFIFISLNVFVLLLQALFNYFQLICVQILWNRRQISLSFEMLNDYAGPPAKPALTSSKSAQNRINQPGPAWKLCWFMLDFSAENITVYWIFDKINAWDLFQKHGAKIIPTLNVWTAVYLVYLFSAKSI